MPARQHVLISLAIVFSFLSLQAVAQVTTATLPVGNNPAYTVVNTATNTIYVANELCDTFPCTVPGTVTVIDGATNNIKATVNVGIDPGPIAVNSVTN
jgi:DNA-binding beta-propeller fold protein YncE